MDKTGISRSFVVFTTLSPSAPVDIGERRDILSARKDKSEFIKKGVITMKITSEKVGTTLAILTATLFMAGNVYAKSMDTTPMEATGETKIFIPATPATDISVAKTRCEDGFVVVYFNNDSEEYPTKKICSEATGGTATSSRRVNPVSNGQGGKKCPGGTEEYVNCTPTQPLPCCFTIAD